MRICSNFRSLCLCTGITCTAMWHLWTSTIPCTARQRRTNLPWRKMATHPSYTPARWEKRWERWLPWSVRLTFKTALDKSRKSRSTLCTGVRSQAQLYTFNLLNQDRFLFTKHNFDISCTMKIHKTPAIKWPKLY